MKILVTGATGFIGSHLIERLIEGGHSVTALIRPTSDSNSFISRGIQTVAGDVADPETVSIAVNEADAVVNLARAKAHGRRPHSALTSVNVEGARNVARAAQRAGAKLVHASSTAVYGSRLENLNADETASLKPDSIYAESKLNGERAVAAEHNDVTVLRISAVLGARCMSWLPLFRSARDGTLPVVGDGSNVHHPVEVTEVVDAIMLALKRSQSGGTYNIAGPSPVMMRDMVRLMRESAGSTRGSRTVSAALVGAYGKVGRMTAKMGVRLPRMESVLFLHGNRSFDISRAKIELGFSPKIDTAEALVRTAEWYRSRGLL